MTLVLVVGSSGFIGRPIVAAAGAAARIDVVGAGRDRSGSGSSGRWLELDLLGPPAVLAGQLDRIAPDVVVNAAGSTTGGPDELRLANVDATARLVAAIEAALPDAVLVQIGSAAEYGHGQVGRATRETDPAEPVGPYGTTKLEATRLVIEEIAAGRLRGVVLRLFNTLGPSMPHGSLPGAALAGLVDAVGTGAREVQLGPLDPVRDFVDVRDVAAAVVSACTVPRHPHPILNIGSGTPHAVRDLVRLLAARVGFSGRIDESGTGSPRSTGVAWQVADIRLAQAQLGWSPRFSLDDSVDLMVGGDAGPAGAPASRP